MYVILFHCLSFSFSMTLLYLIYVLCLFIRLTGCFFDCTQCTALLAAPGLSVPSLLVISQATLGSAVFEFGISEIAFCALHESSTRKEVRSQLNSFKTGVLFNSLKRNTKFFLQDSTSLFILLSLESLLTLLSFLSFSLSLSLSLSISLPSLFLFLFS